MSFEDKTVSQEITDVARSLTLKQGTEVAGGGPGIDENTKEVSAKLDAVTKKYHLSEIEQKRYLESLMADGGFDNSYRNSSTDNEAKLLEFYDRHKTPASRAHAYDQQRAEEAKIFGAEVAGAVYEGLPTTHRGRTAPDESTGVHFSADDKQAQVGLGGLGAADVDKIMQVTDKEEALKVQKELRAAGYTEVKVTGKMDEHTKEAIQHAYDNAKGDLNGLATIMPTVAGVIAGHAVENGKINFDKAHEIPPDIEEQSKADLERQRRGEEPIPMNEAPKTASHTTHHHTGVKKGDKMADLLPGDHQLTVKDIAASLGAFTTADDGLPAMSASEAKKVLAGLQKTAMDTHIDNVAGQSSPGAPRSNQISRT